MSLKSLAKHKSDHQKFQILFIWIEENSYYSSTKVLQRVHKIIPKEKKGAKIARDMKGIKIAMTLHHHLHSPLQKNLWCSNVESLLFLNS
jgi:hypothetical protein